MENKSGYTTRKQNPFPDGAVLYAGRKNHKMTEIQAKQEGQQLAFEWAERVYDIPEICKGIRNFIYRNRSFPLIGINNAIWIDIVRLEYGIIPMAKEHFTSNNWLGTIMKKAGCVPLEGQYIKTRTKRQHARRVMLWTLPVKLLEEHRIAA